MKKRKKPIFLIAIIVLLVCVVGAMNSSLLSTPTTAKELEEQATQEAMANAPKPAQVATAQPAPTPQGALVRPLDEGSALDDMGKTTNIKPVPAIPDDAKRISAPTVRKGQNKRQEKAGASIATGWYMDESGAGK